MEIYKMMQNIRGINIEEEIKQAIFTVKEELKDLTKNQTCFIYSSYIYEEMQNKHLNVRLINTLDLGLTFEHYFVLVNGAGIYYLVDLTYEQFSNSTFNDLLHNDYIKANDNILNTYLSIIARKQISGFTCEKIFYMDIPQIKR